MKKLTIIDPEISHIIAEEKTRESEEINLIASENYVSEAILETTGSILTNKYAEGYPRKRYYSGCNSIDKIELLAIERCKQLFSAEYANVQPHSGSQANMAVYHALIKPGDTIMGMNLASGGHLTHGHNVNFSGLLYKTIQYGVDKETELLNYETIEEYAHRHKPQLIVAGASSYSRIINFQRFASLAKNIGAYFLVDMAHISGLVAAQLHPSPVPYADCVSSTTHKTLRGPRGGFILCKHNYAEQIDRAIMPGIQGGPFMHTIAAKAVAFKEAQAESFKEYQKTIVDNAKNMVYHFDDLGYRIVSGGTDNHLFVIDLQSHNLTGLEAEQALATVGINVSRSLIPFDKQKPWITSGIRIGTPAITTRNISQKELHTLVGYIDETIIHHKNPKKLKQIKEKVLKISKQLPT